MALHPLISARTHEHVPAGIALSNHPSGHGQPGEASGARGPMGFPVATPDAVDSCDLRLKHTQDGKGPLRADHIDAEQEDEEVGRTSGVGIEAHEVHVTQHPATSAQLQAGGGGGRGALTGGVFPQRPFAMTPGMQQQIAEVILQQQDREEQERERLRREMMKGGVLHDHTEEPSERTVYASVAVGRGVQRKGKNKVQVRVQQQQQQQQQQRRRRQQQQRQQQQKGQQQQKRQQQQQQQQHFELQLVQRQQQLHQQPHQHEHQLQQQHCLRPEQQYHHHQQLQSQQEQAHTEHQQYLSPASQLLLQSRTPGATGPSMMQVGERGQAALPDTAAQELDHLTQPSPLQRAAERQQSTEGASPAAITPWQRHEDEMLRAHRRLQVSQGAETSQLQGREVEQAALTDGAGRASDQPTQPLPLTGAAERLLPAEDASPTAITSWQRQEDAMLRAESLLQAPVGAGTSALQGRHIKQAALVDRAAPASNQPMQPVPLQKAPHQLQSTEGAFPASTLALMCAEQLLEARGNEEIYGRLLPEAVAAARPQETARLEQAPGGMERTGDRGAVLVAAGWATDQRGARLAEEEARTQAGDGDREGEGGVPAPAANSSERGRGRPEDEFGHGNGHGSKLSRSQQRRKVEAERHRRQRVR